MPRTGSSPPIVPYGADRTVYLVVDSLGAKTTGEALIGAANCWPHQSCSPFIFGSQIAIVVDENTGDKAVLTVAMIIVPRHHSPDERDNLA